MGMEGERAFVQDLESLEGQASLLEVNPKVAFKYCLGGGYRQSKGWEPLGPAGCYDTFGPELSFTQTLQSRVSSPIAIAKFTHSGSQIIDWMPGDSDAPARNLYLPFINFIRETVTDLKDRGHAVTLEGIFYHLGENDMS